MLVVDAVLGQLLVVRDLSVSDLLELSVLLLVAVKLFVDRLLLSLDGCLGGICILVDHSQLHVANLDLLGDGLDKNVHLLNSMVLVGVGWLS